MNGAIASGDFTIGSMDAVNGAYTLNGSPCLITDIIDITNPDGAFDPVLDIDAGGVKPRDVGGGNYSGRTLVVKSPLLDTLLAGGFTVVFQTTIDPSNTNLVSVSGWDYDTYVLQSLMGFTSLINAPDDDARLRLCDKNGNVSDTSYPDFGSGANKVALTAVGSRMAGCVNGGAVHTREEPFLDPTMNTIAFSLGAAEFGRLRSFAFYPPVDDSDLSALSAL